MSPAERSRSLTRAAGIDRASARSSQSGRRGSAGDWRCPQCHHWLSGDAAVCRLGCARACTRQFGCPLWMSETRMQSPRRQGGSFELLVAIVNPQPALGSSLICRCALLATEAPSEWCEVTCGVSRCVARGADICMCTSRTESIAPPVGQLPSYVTLVTRCPPDIAPSKSDGVGSGFPVGERRKNAKEL